MTDQTTPARTGRPVQLAHPLGPEHLAQRLLAVSSKHSFDPETEIDWDAPVDPELLALPAHRSSLYGTGIWDNLSTRERAALTTRELCSTMVTGLWGELILMQGLIRHVYKNDPRTLNARYALTEVADECRHTAMFARYITRLDYPSSQVRPLARRMGTLLNVADNTTLILAAALFQEEYTDAMQREMARDETLQPLARAVARLHVIEEARHISYARDELGWRCARLGAARRAALAQPLALIVGVLVREGVNPQVYSLSGLDRGAAHRAALANPHWHRARRDWAVKAVAAFTELGLLDSTSRLLWRRAHLLL